MIVIRSEFKQDESRVAVTPSDARKLIEAGIPVRVERFPERCFSDVEYAAAGCAIVEPGTWESALPEGALVLGLKELPESETPITGDHAYFAHAFKGQAGASRILSRFERGDGTLWDWEQLRDESGRRLVAFGYRAGFMGAAVGLLQWHGSLESPLRSWPSEAELLAAIDAAGERGPAPGRILVTGALGRCGRGATAVIEHYRKSHPGTEVTYWDIGNLPADGLASHILEHDLWIHAIGTTEIGAPFLTERDLRGAKRLRLVVDVTADVGNPTHRLPFIGELTTIRQPVGKLLGVEYVAIDHLPTLLPRESSDEFSRAALPLLLAYFDQRSSVPEAYSFGPWSRARNEFHKAVSKEVG